MVVAGVGFVVVVGIGVTVAIETVGVLVAAFVVITVVATPVVVTAVFVVGILVAVGSLQAANNKVTKVKLVANVKSGFKLIFFIKYILIFQLRRTARQFLPCTYRMGK